MQIDTLIVNGILVTVNPDFDIIEKWLVKKPQARFPESGRNSRSGP